MGEVKCLQVAQKKAAMELNSWPDSVRLALRRDAAGVETIRAGLVTESAAYLSK